MVTAVRIPEAGGKRLGRHIEHDPASRQWRITQQVAPLVTVHHTRHTRPYDQGDLGSCTGNAAAGAISTVPLYQGTHLHEPEALQLYGLATQLDGFPGVWPPDDTGSSGLAVAKAAKQLGYIKEYRHAFGIADALAALQTQPVITGVNWYEGFDAPSTKGLIEIGGEVRGGHEFEVTAFILDHHNTADSLVWAYNSWGSRWGVHGRFCFKVSTWARLLAEQGDVTVLVA